jgi:hypothetical protein
MDDRSPRIQAARWVLLLGRLYGALMACAVAWSLLAVVVLGAPVLLLVSALLAGYAAAWGALLTAFAAHRRGAWRLLVAVTAVGVLGPWGGGSAVLLDVVVAAVHATLFALLMHRDSREWVAVEESPAEPSRRPSIAGH